LVSTFVTGQTNISKYGKEITQSVLKQIRIALVVLFAFTKETFLPRDKKKGEIWTLNFSCTKVMVFKAVVAPQHLAAVLTRACL
jgi:hypothetical protein